MDCIIKKGSVVYAKVDVIINAANEALEAGSGVCGAIFNTCGHYDELQKECKKLAPIKEGEAVITDAFDLNAKYIIHAVGPKYKNDIESPRLLFDAYYNSLKLADEKGLKSIAFPSISTGIFGYPLDKAAIVALTAIKMFNGKNLNECFIYCFDDRTYNEFTDRQLKKSILDKDCKSMRKRETYDLIKQAIVLPYLSDLYLFLLDCINGVKNNYIDYFNSMNVDEEIKNIKNMDYDTLTALLTMILREEHFVQGSLKQRYEQGEINKILNQMLRLI